jgi:beta-glucanase (GH16 family)
MMRFVLLLVWCSLGVAWAEDPSGWELVWNDEFDGEALDQRKWGCEVNANGGGNNELQYYVTNNVSVKGGLLQLEARRERFAGAGGTRDYTSSRIRTRRLGDWRYGRVDVRARLPQGRGIWPAIWLLPTDEKYGGWPHSGEIDIMELLGHEPNKVYGTLHYSDSNGRHRHRGTNTILAAGTFADDFHVFRLDWDAGQMRWYVDDRLYQTQTNWTRRRGDFPAPFDQRFHLLLNVAVGGNWPGQPDASTKFPQSMAVDYVRIYRRK